MSSVQTITRAIRAHAQHRDLLVRQRKVAPYCVDADTDIVQVRADLDHLIAKEDARIDQLLAELHEARQAATV